MRASISLVIAALAALAAAYPRAQDEVDADSTPSPLPTTSLGVADPTLSITASTSLNIPVTLPSTFATPTAFLNTSSSSRHRNSHWEPIPIFSKSCDCPSLATVAYPCWATDALQRCNFEELHSFVCWTSAAYGCPTPTRTCENLFTPTPLTGRHPCDPGVPDLPTDNPSPVITATPTVTAAPKKRWQDMTYSPEKYGVRK